jgi:L,D-transpeptidase YcbB
MVGSSLGGKCAMKIFFVLASIAFLSLFSVSALAEENQAQRLVKILQSGQAGEVRLQDAEGLLDFYRARDYKPFFYSGFGWSSQTKDTIDVIEDSWTHGLNPQNYHYILLKDFKHRAQNEDPMIWEVILADAVARYGKDMTGMRLSANRLQQDRRSWLTGTRAFNMLSFLADQNDFEEALEQLGPKDEYYREMRQALMRAIHQFRTNSDENNFIFSFGRSLRPMDQHPHIKILRQRLLEQDGTAIYDAELVEAVKKFQQDQGLRPDGIIGRNTEKALNRGVRDDIIRLTANMERHRWIDPRMPQKYLLVNIPSMTLIAFDQGEEIFNMNVVVGRPERPTLSFITNAVGVRFNPSWHVPPTIKSEDFLPKLQKNPNALKEKGIELIQYTSDGAKPLNPTSIDWASMTPEGLKSIGMIQDPGDENPLGRVRVLMPNSHDIYLHDTNTPDLFSKQDRALSSGCVRVADAKKLAIFLLKGADDFSDDRIDTYLGKAKTIEVRTAQPVPVYLLYQTLVWDQGRLKPKQDIYNQDEKLARALAQANKLPIDLGF